VINIIELFTKLRGKKKLINKDRKDAITIPKIADSNVLFFFSSKYLLNINLPKTR
jgi:hypothetical protein